MEEERNIKVTLEQAMKWYNSGDSTLRTLALSAYTEDELKLDFKYINSKVCNTCFCANVPVDEAEKYNTLVDLAVIAKFFNGSWKKTISNTGYFISNCSRCNNVVCTCNGVDIYQHCSVQHAGVIYFKDKMKKKFFDAMDKAGYEWDGETLKKKGYQFKPFEKVLVRDNETQKWRCAFYSHFEPRSAYCHVTTNCAYAMCIPFEGNEHLVNTTNNP